MPKSIVFGNGNLNVNFDDKLQLNDFYYPYVGSENHSDFRKYNRVGIFVDEKISWLSEDPHWNFSIKYHPKSLVGNSTAKNNEKKISLKFEDFVYTTHDIFVRKITIQNKANYERNIKVFAHHNFHIYGQKLQETAIYEPTLNAVCHYRKSRYFLVNGQWDDSKEGMNQFTTGVAGYQGHEGTFRDAEDGILTGHPVEQGSVDSTVGFESHFKANEVKTLWTWVAVGKNEVEMKENNDRILSLGPQVVFAHTKNYWEAWAQKSGKEIVGLSKPIIDLWYQSALIMRTNIDNRGAIIAATDSDIMEFNQDTYTYMWPRDGSLVSIAMANAGFSEVVRNFLFFCEKIVTPEGYFQHKYTPEGLPGTSWHPKWSNGKIQRPIQEDESALVLVALEAHYKNTKNIENVQHFFNSLVLKIGNFLIDFTDKNTGLPYPSYDLWEEKMGIYSYTTATVYAGLNAAANLSLATGHLEDEKKFRKAAKKMQSTLLKSLFCENSNRFLKKINLENGKIIERDNTIDSSIAFIWEMGVIPADDPRMVSTMEAIEETLSIQHPTGGLCRYNDDYYQRNPHFHYDEKIPGNPWIITTLWLANWKIAMAKNRIQLKSAESLIEWVYEKANSAGLLPEQIDAFENKPISVAPLTWSHSSFLDTVQRFSEKYESMK